MKARQDFGGLGKDCEATLTRNWENFNTVLGQIEAPQILSSAWNWSWKRYGNSIAKLTYIPGCREGIWQGIPKHKIVATMQQSEYGVPPMLMYVRHNMYRDCKSSVRSAYGDRMWFVVKTGVRQMSVLSPLQLVLLMDQVGLLKSTDLQLVSWNGDLRRSLWYLRLIMPTTSACMTWSATELQQLV